MYDIIGYTKTEFQLAVRAVHLGWRRGSSDAKNSSTRTTAIVLDGYIQYI